MATVASSKRHLVLTSDTYTSNGDVVVGGDLTIQGTTTTLNTTNLLVEDKNIIIGNVSSPSDTTANGGGITLKGSNDYTITWSNANNRWDFNQGITSSGNITAANISGSTSGTNTGDQVLPDDFVSKANGGTFSGDVTVSGASIKTLHTASDQNTSADSSSIPSTTGVEFLRIGSSGTYSDGRYTHEFAKVDRGGNLSLYLRESKSTANSFSNIVRFGDNSHNSETLEVFGTIGASNFSGSSSGTNTGDQDLSGYATTGSIPTDFVSAANGGTFSGDVTITHANTPKLVLKDTTDDLTGQVRVANNYMYINIDSSDNVAQTRLQFQTDGVTAMYLDQNQKATFEDDVNVNGNIDMGTNIITDTKVGQWDTAYEWGDHSEEGYITGVTNISGYAGSLLRSDNRTISPSEETAGRLKFGFTSWANTNTAPYADFLHLRSYTDSSGGSDNLVMFKKSGIGMRIWQQSFGSSTAYSNYVDVLTSADEGSGNGLHADLLDGKHESYFANLSKTQTISGNKTFTNSGNTFNGHLYYTAYDANGNHYPHFRAGSNANGTTIQFRQYYNATSFITHVWKATSASDAYFDFNGQMRPNGLLSDGNVNVIGDINVGSASDTNAFKLNLHGSTANKVSTIKTTSGNLHIDSEDGHGLYLNYYEGASTNIYFGTGNGGYCGTVSSAGLLRMANDVVAYYSFSDRRLKTDIKTTENNLEKILSLNPVEYTWKEGPREGVKEIGLIAQEVEEVVPEVVRVQSRHHDEKSEGEEYKQVDYEHLVSTLIGAMQEQQQQINELKSQMAACKERACNCKN